MLQKNFDILVMQLCSDFSVKLRNLIEFEGFRQECDLGFDNGLMMWNGLSFERLLRDSDFDDLRRDYDDGFYLRDRDLMQKLRHMREELVAYGLPLITNKPGHVLVEYHIQGIYGMHKLDSSDEDEEEQFFQTLKIYIRKEMVESIKSKILERNLYGAISASVCDVDLGRSDYATITVDAKFCVVLYYR